VLQVVVEAIRSVAPEIGDDLGRETSISSLAIDSIKQMQMIGEVQDVFAVRIPELRLWEIETCGDIVDAVCEQVQTREFTQAPTSSDSVLSSDQMREYEAVLGRIKSLEMAGTRNPYFAVVDAVDGNKIASAGADLIDFARFNYLGMSGDPVVTEAAKKAIDQFGTSTSSSRLVSGTTRVHEELENALACLLGSEAALVFTSGFVTNTTVIGHLMRSDDLILHDELIHNSIITGANLSGAARRVFPHNDWNALDEMLHDLRNRYGRVLVIIEGVYSMDGDYPDVPEFVQVKNRHEALLMVDEAHSLGTLGSRGRGVCDHFDIDPHDIDIRIGTLGKALGGAGGFIAGSLPQIEYIRYTCPGIVFTTALAPSAAAAALAGIRLLENEPQRVSELQARAGHFLKRCQEAGFDTGTSYGTPIIPVILGSSDLAIRASEGLRRRGINVPPIVYPAVSEAGARLRFFITKGHTESQMDRATAELADLVAELGIVVDRSAINT
jgi:8-amino-7-oxononanoate synthase